MRRAWNQRWQLATLAATFVIFIMVVVPAVMPVPMAWAESASDITQMTWKDRFYSIPVPGVSTVADKTLFSDIMQSRGYEISDANLTAEGGLSQRGVLTGSVSSSARAVNSTDGTAVMFLQFDNVADLQSSEAAGEAIYDELSQRIGADDSFLNTSGAASYQTNTTGTVTAFYAVEGTSMVFGYIGASQENAEELLSQLGFIEGTTERVGRIIIAGVIVIIALAILYYILHKIITAIKIRSQG